MMRFPSVDQLELRCQFEGLVPGKLHADGRRYLPLVLLRLPAHPTVQPAVELLGVVDRHHVVDPALEGRSGVARLVFLLSRVRLQDPPLRQGLEPEGQLGPGQISTAPTAYGRVVTVPSWEAEREHLPYEALFTELILDIGMGVVGVRTSATAASLADSLGKPQIEPGDWLRVWRSRIDILEFRPA